MKRKKKDQKAKDDTVQFKHVHPKPTTRVSAFDYDSTGDVRVTVSDGYVYPLAPWSPVTDVPQRFRDALRVWLGGPTEPEVQAAAKTLATWLELHDLSHGPIPCAAHDEGQWCCVDKTESVGRTPDDPVGERPNAIRAAIDTLLAYSRPDERR